MISVIVSPMSWHSHFGIRIEDTEAASHKTAVRRIYCVFSRAQPVPWVFQAALHAEVEDLALAQITSPQRSAAQTGNFDA